MSDTVSLAKIKIAQSMYKILPLLFYNTIIHSKRKTQLNWDTSLFQNGNNIFKHAQFGDMKMKKPAHLGLISRLYQQYFVRLTINYSGMAPLQCSSFVYISRHMGNDRRTMAAMLNYKFNFVSIIYTLKHWLSGQCSCIVYYATSIAVIITDVSYNNC